MTFLEANQIIEDFYGSVQFGRPINRVQTHKVLFDVVQKLQPKKYGEIGSHIGCSLSYVSLACNAFLYSYDFPNAGSGGEAGTDGFLKQAAKHFAKDRHSLNFGNSHSVEIKRRIVENGPYDVFMIDGDHSSEGCMEDFKTVLPNVKLGGAIIIDDLVHHLNLGVLFDKIVRDGGFRYEKFMEQDETVLRGVGVIYL